MILSSLVAFASPPNVGVQSAPEGYPEPPLARDLIHTFLRAGSQPSRYAVFESGEELCNEREWFSAGSRLLPALQGTLVGSRRRA